MSSGKITLPHTCPKCGVIAETKDELENKFGLRTMTSTKGEKSLRNQSQCKKCR